MLKLYLYFEIFSSNVSETQNQKYVDLLIYVLKATMYFIYFNQFETSKYLQTTIEYFKT
jgi:hypothetical protein